MSTSCSATDSRRALQTAMPTTRQLKCRVLDSLKLASIAFFRKFAEPQAIAVFDGGLGPRAAHGGAGLELFEDVFRHPLSLFDRLRGSDQFCQLMRTVVSALRCGRFYTSAEAQITGAVLRPIEQIVDFLQIPRAALQLVLDHAPTPGVGRCIAHSAGNALALGELADDVAERKLERIEFDRVLALQVTVAVAKTADERSVAQLFHFQERCRHGVERTGQLNVDIGLALRSHIRSSTSAICGRARADATLPASCHGYQRRDARRHRESCRGRVPTGR